LQRRPEVSRDDEPYAPSSKPNPEELSILKEERAAGDDLLEALRAEVKGDAAAELLALAEEDEPTPGELAARLGVPVKQIYLARDRLMNAAKRLLCRKRSAAIGGDA
jgi:hypothetical protein